MGELRDAAAIGAFAMAHDRDGGRLEESSGYGHPALRSPPARNEGSREGRPDAPIEGRSSRSRSDDGPGA